MFGLSFPSAADVARTGERHKRLLASAQHFADAKAPRTDDSLMLHAETYTPDNPMTLVFGDVTASTSFLPNDDAPHSPNNRYAYSPVVLPQGESLDVPYAPGRRASIYFTGDIVIPRLVERQWTVWMSTTPAEIWSQTSGIRYARDTVVVGGLGMGWQLSQIVKRKAVKKVIVVEQSQELLNWYGYELCAKLGVDEVVCGDVWDTFSRFEPGDPKVRFVLDVWPHWWDARCDRDLAKQRRAGHNVWAWGSPRGGTDR